VRGAQNVHPRHFLDNVDALTDFKDKLETFFDHAAVDAAG
jgi:hypothetical protein